MSSVSSALSALGKNLRVGPNSENEAKYLKEILTDALEKYVGYIKQYETNKAIIDKIIQLLESFPGISSPLPLKSLPKIDGLDGIYSFVSATINSTSDQLLQLYLLKLLYFKFKVPTKSTPSSERESRNRDYRNTPSENIVCNDEFLLLYDLYKRYSNATDLNSQMFVVFYKKLFPPTKS